MLKSELLSMVLNICAMICLSISESQVICLSYVCLVSVYCLIDIMMAYFAKSLLTCMFAVQYRICKLNKILLLHSDSVLLVT